MKTALALIAAIVCFAAPAFSQTTPALTFTLETSSTDGRTVVPRLTWSTTPAASTCAASGATDWTGTKAAAGTVVLAAVNASRTFSLVCTWPGVTIASLNWTAPTLNVDGTSYTNPGGYRVQWGRAANDLTESAYLNDPAARTWTSPALAPGAWFFALRAFNALGLESDPTNVVTRTMTAPANQTRALELAIRFPRPPVLNE